MRKASTIRRSIIVAHPGTQHSYEMALAVQEAGLLHSYVTGIYDKRPSLVGSALRLLSPARRGLLGRRKDGLSSTLVRLHPFAELSYLAAARVRPLARHARRLVRWRNRWFDKRIERTLLRQQPAGVVCYDTCALRTFKAAADLGIWRVLDQSIGHWRTLARMMREEAELCPDFADSLPLDLPQWFLEQCSEEAKLADVILAGSQYVKDTMQRQGVEPSRIAVVPYGADLQQFAPAPRPNDGRLKVLFVGQLSQRKGIKYLLEAVRQLGVPALELVLAGGVVGSGSGLIRYRDNFTHRPAVPHSEVYRYFQEADLFVYPSLHEGSAIAIYAALAAGLPVITTPNSGSVVRDGVEGFIVPIRDVEALKQKILFLYENPGLREQMACAARRRATQFSWAIYRKRIGLMLERMLAGDRHDPMSGSETAAPSSTHSPTISSEHLNEPALPA